MVHQPSSKSRVVRVFVSSTFRDMETERDLLAKRTFPELRERCRKRGIEFVDVDLRWGITREQAERGETLPICLDEIEYCRPYFIGLLGERYGWVPDHIDEELLDRQPWLREHLDRSITELEILYGVLLNPKMADRSYFYFRDPAYVTSFPDDERVRFAAASPQVADKLETLKRRIRDADFPVYVDYPSPKAVSARILDDLWGAIDEEFPKGTEPDPLEREALEHAAFAESRARSYIARDEQYARLDKQAAGDGPPLAITGESGIGKSALLANWVTRYRAAHPEAFVLEHYIGSTAHSTDYVAILRRIMGEFKRRFGIEEELPHTPETLKWEFPNWLSMAAARGHVVLILDGLNQLEDRDDAPDLYWLPEYFPPNVRLFLSTLPGRSMDTLARRAWPTYEVEPLIEDECSAFILGHLRLYGKHLESDQLERIVNQIMRSPLTRNPLYLRVLLEEIRVFGSFEKLDRRIDHYLAAPTIAALYGLVLERLEEDYDCDRPSLVRDSTSCVWASRRGLAESELLEMLGAGGERLPQAVWSPLYLALRESLVTRSGLLTFFHDYLREAVRQRYLPDEGAQRTARKRLADYFGRQETTDRKVAELPWQLAQMEEWQRLANLLSDTDFAAEVWESDRFELKRLWVQIEANSDSAMTGVYARFLEGDRGDWFDLQLLARLFQDLGKLDPARVCYRRALRGLPTEPTDTELMLVGELYLGLSNLEEQTGDFDASTRWTRRATELARRRNDADLELRCLEGEGLDAKKRSQWSEAKRIYRRALDLADRLGRLGSQGRLHNNIGNVEKNLGNYEAALSCFRSAADIARRLPDRLLLSRVYNGMGDVSRELGRLDEADEWYRQSLDLKDASGDLPGMASCYVGLGNVAACRGRHDEAIGYYRQALEAQPQNRALEANCCLNMAIAEARRGNEQEAGDLLWRSVRLKRELGLQVEEWVLETLGEHGERDD